MTLVISKESKICLYYDNSRMNFFMATASEWIKLPKRSPTTLKKSSSLIPKALLTLFLKGEAPHTSALYQIFPSSQPLINVCLCPRSFPRTLHYSLWVPPLDSRHLCTPVVPCFWLSRMSKISKGINITWPTFYFLSMGFQKQPPLFIPHHF